MTMPVMAMIAATICRIEHKEIEKNWCFPMSGQAIEDFLRVAKCFLKPNYLLYIAVSM